MEQIISVPPFCYEEEEDATKIATNLFFQKEFHELRSCFPNKEHYLNHQKIISRYLSPYRLGVCPTKFLVLHSTGTGKSGVASCLFDEYYSLYKNKFVFIFLGPNTITLDNFQIELKKLSINYKEIYGRINSFQKKKRKEKNIIFSKYSRADLEVLTENLTDIQKQLQFIIIIDEVHNLIDINQTKDNKKIETLENQRYQSLERFLKSIPKKICIYMTATPLRHSIYEVVPLLNLIIEDNEEKLNLNIFNKKNWKEVIQRAIEGKISYYRTNERDRKVITVFESESSPNFSNLNEDMIFKVNFSTMEEEQSNIYLEALFNNYSKENSRKNILPPPNFSDELIEKRNSPSKFRNNGKKIQYKFDSLDFFYSNDNRSIHRRSIISNDYELLEKIQNCTSERENLNQVRRYSIIFYNVIKEILSEPDKRFFIYSKYIKKSGIESLISILKIAFGFKDASKSENINSKRQYIYLKPYSSEKNNDDKENIHSKTLRLVSKFNNNMNIQVIFCSDKCSESLTFLDIERIHCLTPWWNFCRLKQIFGRAIRFRSHDRLIEKKKKYIFLNHLSKSNIPNPKDLERRLMKNKKQNCTEDYQIQFMNAFLSTSNFYQNEELDKQIDTLRENMMKEMENININVKIFLHCALPNMTKYNLIYQEHLTKEGKEKISQFEILQLKQFQQASKREKEIRDVIFLFFQNSIDFYLNYDNNRILSEDNYFTLQDYRIQCKEKFELMLEKNSDRQINTTNYDELYISSDTSTMEKISLVFQNNQKKALMFQDIVNYSGESDVRISKALMNLISKSKLLCIDKDEYYLNYRCNYFYLTKNEEDSVFSKKTKIMKLPRYNMVETKYVKKKNQTFNLESIKDIVKEENMEYIVEKSSLRLPNLKRKYNELDQQEQIDLLKKIKIKNENKELTEDIMKRIDLLPAPLKEQIEVNETKDSNFVECSESIKNIAQNLLFNNEIYISKKQNLQEGLFAVEINKNIFLFQLTNSFILNDQEKNKSLKKKILLHVQKKQKKYYDFALAEKKITRTKLNNMVWEKQESIVVEILKRYAEENNLNFDFKNHLNNIKKLDELYSEMETEKIKRMFDINMQFSNCFLQSQTHDDNYFDNEHNLLYLYSMWLCLVHINYLSNNIKDNHLQKEYILFFQKYYTDKRLESTGRNLSSFYIKELYQCFTKFFPNDMDIIKDDIKLYEENNDNKKKVSLKRWREVLIEILKKNNLYLAV